MFRRCHDCDRNVSDGDVADAVNDRDLPRTKPFARLGGNTFELGNRHWFVGFVREAGDCASVVAVRANGAQERYACARAVVRRFGERAWIDRRARNAQQRIFASRRRPAAAAPIRRRPKVLPRR